MNDYSPSPPLESDAQSADFLKLLAAFDAWRGQPVSIHLADCHSGFAVGSMTGVFSGAELQDNRLEIRLGDGENWIAIFEDMVGDVHVDDRETAITYHAGDITIRRRTPRIAE